MDADYVLSVNLFHAIHQWLHCMDTDSHVFDSQHLRTLSHSPTQPTLY